MKLSKSILVIVLVAGAVFAGIVTSTIVSLRSTGLDTRQAVHAMIHGLDDKYTFPTNTTKNPHK